MDAGVYRIRALFSSLSEILMAISRKRTGFCFQLVAVLCAGAMDVSSVGIVAQPSAGRPMVASAAIRSEVNEFLAKEVARSANIMTFTPLPDRVFSPSTVGESSWEAIAPSCTGDIGGNKTIAGKDTARAIAEMGLYESRQGGKAFSQLYSTLALRHYGTDLSKNAVWQSMNESERKEWHSLLDPARFYDAKKRAVINLPENYLGVAARVAAMSYVMGVLKDRALLDWVVERAAEQFTSGALYSDDGPPTGRYDRYSNSTRFCWDAADIAGRSDIKESETIDQTSDESGGIWSHLPVTVAGDAAGDWLAISTRSRSSAFLVTIRSSARHPMSNSPHSTIKLGAGSAKITTTRPTCFASSITAAATILTSIQNVSGSRQAPAWGRLF